MLKSLMIVGAVLSLSEDELIYLSENGWSVQSPFPLNSLTNEVTCITHIALFQQYFDYDIPVYASIEPDFGHAMDLHGFAYTDPQSKFETTFGDCIDLIETEPIEGYWWECGLDNGVRWLKSRTTKKLVQDIVPGNISAPIGNPNAIPSNPGNTLQWRLSTVDAVVCEVYTIQDLIWPGQPTAISIGQFMQAHCPTIPYGFKTTWSDDPTFIDDPWWSTSPYGPRISIETQLRNAATWLGYLKSELGVSFGYTCAMATGEYEYNLLGVQWYARWIDTMNAIGWPYPPTNNIKVCWQDTKQEGVLPYYTGAAVCTHPATSPLTDTFVNTGSELIILKSFSSENVCKIHDITVTSTDRLTHEDYTIALPPDRGTLLGPYPTEEYGTAPTIIYDNNKLNVSVLKARSAAA